MSHDVDELLREAGARWRAEQPPPAEPMLTDAARAPWRRHTVVLAAVAAVLVVVAGALVVARAAGHHKSAPPAGPANLVLRDGDTAEATGVVIAKRGKPVLFCPAKYGFLAFCSAAGLEVTGVDLRRLTDRWTSPGGTIIGKSALRGRYSSGTLQVTQQTAPQSRVTWVPEDEAQPAFPRPQCSPTVGIPALIVVTTRDPAHLLPELTARYGTDPCIDLVTAGRPGYSGPDPSADAWVAALTEPLLEKLRKIDLPGLQIHVWLRPVH